MIKKINALAIYLLFLVPLLKPISTKLGVTILTYKVFLQTNKVNAENADFWLNKGNESFDKGNYFEAIFNYTELLKKDRNSSKAYLNRGMSRINIGDYYGGIIDYLKASKISPKESYIFEDIGDVYNYDLNNYKKAIEYYSTAIRLEPNSVYAYNNRGYVYQNINNFEKSILDFKKSIEINNSDPYIYYELARSQFNLGYTTDQRKELAQEAFPNVNKAIELENNNKDFYYLRANILMVLEDTKYCLDLQKASDLGDQNYRNFLLRSYGDWEYNCKKFGF